ncbi:chromosome segregation protein SMC [Clostridia bacterium OttesenSCG-928-F22]|nr:chromosome segregation protein SMC [Clostridia bacterium OttesenSCG-928-F22]
MRLKRLEVYGFKSFAQRTQIEFVDGITAIVGPNGSGKSNVSDAVRWVLGEQSAKSLRGSSMQDIIFSGTQSRKPLSTCEVTLVFDNEDGTLPIEYTEVAVTRRVYRSGDNEYLINKKQCRLKDIIELFHDTGIGKEGYSVIGQGKINDILSSKSDDRRAILEEAAGITKYKARKNEAERKLEHTSNNIIRMEDILEELEGQLGPLQEQSEQARLYFGLREELKGLELNLFLRQHEKTQERTDTLNENIRSFEELYEKEKQEEMELLGSELEQKMRRLDADISETSEGIVNLSAEIERQQGQDKLLTERIENAMREQARLREEQHALMEKKAQTEQLAKSKADELAVQQQVASQAQQQLTEREEALKQRIEVLEHTEAALEEKKEAVFASMNRLGDAKSKKARLEAMINGITARMIQTEKEIEACTQEREKLQLEQQRYRDNIAKIEQDASFYTQQILQLEQQRQQKAEQLTQAKTAVREVEDGIKLAQSRYKMLQDMQNHYEGYHYSVKKVLSAKDSEIELRGCVEDVVASVIKVPSKLVMAVELALGGALQNIITKDEQAAKRVIEYLRRNQAGRATLLPITAMKPRYLNDAERRALQMQGVYGVASELVEYDKKYTPVIENLLGRVVIVEDLDCGIALMKQVGYSFKAVTLKGDILSPGGSMTGGSVSSKTAGLLGREQNIEQERKNITLLEKRLKELDEEKQAIMQALEELMRKGEVIRQGMHTYEVDTAREKEKLDAAQVYVEKNRQTAMRLELEKSQLTDTENDIAGQLEEMQRAQAEMEQSSAHSNEDIAAMQQVVTKLRAQREEQSEILSSMRMQVQALEMECRALETEQKRLNTDALQMQRELGAYEGRIDEAGKVADALRMDTSRYAEQQTADLSKLEALKKTLKNYEEEKRAMLDEMEQSGSRRSEIQQRMNELLDKKFKAEMQIVKLEADMKAAADRIWEEYELTYAGALAYKQTDFQFTKATRSAEEIKSQIRELGDINPRAIEEYESVNSRYLYLGEQRDDLLKAKDDLNQLIEELLVKMRAQFGEQLTLIDQNFREVFVKLFGGGSAKIRLMGDDILSSPIEIEAQPPGKRLQTLSLLSGGEKSLVALALLFAIFSLRPAPFCILDEVDTSLDEVNVDRFADYVKRYKDTTQFILITHRKNSMTAADSMFGVAMEEKGVSRIVSVRMSDEAV